MENSDGAVDKYFFPDCLDPFSPGYHLRYQMTFLALSFFSHFPHSARRDAKVLYQQLEINLYSLGFYAGRDGTEPAWYNDTANCIVLGCGGQVGSECAMDAGFVRTRGIRQELHREVKWPTTGEAACTLGPQPPHHQLGEMRVTRDDTQTGGGWRNTPTKHFTYW